LLNSTDLDLAAGGVLLLPDQSSGGHTHLLVQSGKEGRISLVDRDNMGGYNTSTDNIVQELPVNNSGQTNQNFQMGGLWGMPGFGNNTIYFWGPSDKLKSFPLANGTLSSTPSKTGAQSAGFSKPDPGHHLQWKFQSHCLDRPNRRLQLQRFSVPARLRRY
jgi:hypothetical protein